MKKISIFLIGIIAASSIAYVGINNYKPTSQPSSNTATTTIPKAHGKVEYVATDENSLIKDSQFIITGKVEGASDVKLHETYFTISNVRVENSIKGIAQKNSVIKVIQTKNIAEDELLQKNEKVLLFLEEYKGPITSEKAYVLKGLYQGNYKLDNKKIKGTIEGDNKKLKEKMESIDLDVLAKKAQELK